jgi:hypothetical protein
VAGPRPTRDGADTPRETDVDKQIRQMLNEAEQDLLRRTETAALKQLDEDALLELHRRVRRARNKYAKLYRRRAAAQVAADSSRARASAANSRTAVKAELFEDALARVSRRLAREAWISADRLRQDRLAAARRIERDKADAKAAKAGGTKRSKGKADAEKNKAKGKQPKASTRTPASARSTASARSRTRKAQAKRDAR